MATGTHRTIRGWRYGKAAMSPRRGPNGLSLGSRTTITGQGAWWTTCWLTEPSRRLAKPPRPRLPTTRRSASRASCSRTSAACPSTAMPSHCRAGCRRLTTAIDSRTTSSAPSRNTSITDASTPGESPPAYAAGGPATRRQSEESLHALRPRQSQTRELPAQSLIHPPLRRSFPSTITTSLVSLRA